MRYSPILLLTVALLPFQSTANPATDLPFDSLQTPGTYSIPINFTVGENSKYVATFAVGSQQTEMQIIMDLGSPLTWLYGPNVFEWGNSSIAGPFNCQLDWTPHYSPNLSTTATLEQFNWDIAYGGNSKTISGNTLSIDTLSADPSSSGPRLPILIASTATIRQTDTLACLNPPADYDGIFGLCGSSNISQVEDASFRYNLQHPPPPQAPLIDSATMSVFMRNATTTPVFQTMSGEVLLGGIDTSAFVGPLVGIANTSTDPFSGYTVAFPTLSTNGVNIDLDPTLGQFDGGCIIDSGTSEDVWPINLFTDYNYTPQTFLEQSGLLALTASDGASVWAYPTACADIPANATFDFTWSSPSGQNVTVMVPIRNYARSTEEVDDQSCALSLDVIGCILGAPFLSATYFFVDDDAGIVALAQAGEGTGGRVAIGSGESVPGLIV